MRNYSFGNCYKRRRNNAQIGFIVELYLVLKNETYILEFIVFAILQKIKIFNMKTHNREILIYYNPESSPDRKTVAYAQSVVAHVKSYSFEKNPSSSSSWQMILKSLGRHPKELMNKAHPYYQQHIRGREFDEESWINVLQRNPQLLRAPIAIRGNKAILCESPTDIYKLVEVART